MCSCRGGSLRRIRGGFIAHCGCGILYTVPVRTDAELAALYDTEDYFDVRLAALPSNDADVDAAVRDQEPRVRFLSRLRPPGLVLDVGAATGFFLLAAQRYGWAVAAVEPSAPAWNWARERFDLPQAAPVLRAVQSSAQFDAICFWHSLEHHAEPRVALRIAAEHLRSRGVLIVECPNAGSLDARLNRAHWDGWHLPYHTVHFTPRALSRELERCGLKVESIRTSLWTPVAALARRLHSSPSVTNSACANSPFMLRQVPGSPSAYFARVFSGRDMVVVARAP